jgi:hypothetical protein
MVLCKYRIFILGVSIMTYMSRAGRLTQILTVLKENKGAYTSHRLAKMCGMSPSQHFIGMLCELYHTGNIYGSASVRRNGKKVYYWSKSCIDQPVQLPGFEE